MGIKPDQSDKLKIISSCMNRINKKLPDREINLLEGILETKSNNFTYQEVVKAQYPNIEEIQAKKIAGNYKAYFGSLRQNFQDYYDNSPCLKGFGIKVTKANFKRLLDTYIFENNASELLHIRISNIFSMVESLNQLKIEPQSIENLELFSTKIEKIIQIFENLLETIKEK